MTELTSRLEELRTKYQAGTKEELRAETAEAFNAQAADTRVSKAPSLEKELSTEALFRKTAEIQLKIAKFDAEYGKLNVNFSNAFGKKSFLTTGDMFNIAKYNMTFRSEKADEVKIEAAARHGQTLDTLVGKMAEVLNEQYQRTKELNGISREMQTKVVAHMKYLDKSLIDNLKGGTFTTSDLVEAEAELASLQLELSELDTVLGDYEVQIQTARDGKNIDLVKSLSEEMVQVLDIKHGVLDGRLAANDVASEIRREIVKSTEGVQSAKGAIADAEAIYQTNSLLIDAMNALEIKYHNLMDHVVPNLKNKARQSSIAQEAIGMKNAILEAGQISQELTANNIKLVGYLAEQVQQLTQTPITDADAMLKLRDEALDIRERLHQNDVEWTNRVMNVHSQKTQPHYQTQQ